MSIFVSQNIVEYFKGFLNLCYYFVETGKFALYPFYFMFIAQSILEGLVCV